MRSHRSYGPRDDEPLPESGDLAFVGLDMRAPSLVPAGFVAGAKNKRVIEGVYETRRGLFSPVWVRHAAEDFPYRASYLRDDDSTWTNDFAETFGGGVYSDPDGETWIVRVCASALLFFRETEIGRIILFGANLTVEAPVQVFQNFNELVIVRGDEDTSLVWDGSWNSRVEELVPSSIPGGSAAAPNSHYGLAWRERAVFLTGRDEITFGTIGDNSLYDTDNIFYVNRGRGDRLRSAAPLGGASLAVLKSQSFHVVTYVESDLTDVRIDEQPIDMQFDSPHTTITADNRVWWLDRRGVRTAQLSGIEADNKVLVKFEVLSDPIRPLIRRIAWKHAATFTAAVTEERIFFAVALDDQTTPQTLLVWNRPLSAWESYDQWNAEDLGDFHVLAFAPAVPWLNQPRLFAIDADGQIACLDYSLGEDCVGYSGEYPVRADIEDELLTRGYIASSPDAKRILRAQVQLDTWAVGSAGVALAAIFDGPGEELALAAVSRSRTEYFTGATAFVENNSGGDFHTAKRQDYSVNLAGASPASGYSEWSADSAYVLGQHVFRSKTGHNYTSLGSISGTGHEGTQPGRIEDQWAYNGSSASLDTWEPGETYAAGDTVIYSSGSWTCLQGHTSAYGTVPEETPWLWTDNGLDSSLLAGAVRIGPTLSAYHSADANQDAVISAPELNRVVELYNYRNGMAVRTGEYHTDAAAYSGYAPGPGSITTYHSADTDEDGRISLLELTRVIELYNADAYYVSAGTEDGFAPGPATEGIRVEDHQSAIERRSIGREAAWCQVRIRGVRGANRVRSVAIECQTGPRSNLVHT